MKHQILPTLGALGIAALGMTATSAHAASDAEIAALRQQIRALEARLDGVQRQTTSTARSAANANAKANAC